MAVIEESIVQIEQDCSHVIGGPFFEHFRQSLTLNHRGDFVDNSIKAIKGKKLQKVNESHLCVFEFKMKSCIKRVIKKY
jgi:hypothetical protein